MNQPFESIARNRRRAAGPLAIAGLLGLASLGQGCAFLNRDNTPTLNFVEKTMWPEDKGQRALAAPVVYPIGLLAVAADAAVVHPATVIDDAAEDARKAGWDDMDWDKNYVEECVVLPMRLVGTPIYFARAWVGRSLFNIEDRAEASRSRETVRTDVARANDQLAQGDAEGAMRALEPLEGKTCDLDANERHEAQRQIFLAQLKAARKLGRNYPAFNFTIREALLNGEGSEVMALLRELKDSTNPVERLNGLRLLIDINEDSSLRLPLLREGLRDDDAIVRHTMLGLVPCVAEMRKLILADVEKMAASDKEPLNRSLAAEAAEALKRIED